MMFGMSAEQLTLILVIAALIVGVNRSGRSAGELRSQLQKELGRMPVYSAETTNHREAEFIRDRLPKRWRTIAVLVAAGTLLIAASAWWLAR